MLLACYSPGMGAIQVKHVPDDLHDAVRRRARDEGLDVQDYVLGLLRRELALPSQWEWLEELRRQPRVSTPPGEQTLDTVRDESLRDADRH